MILQFPDLKIKTKHVFLMALKPVSRSSITYSIRAMKLKQGDLFYLLNEKLDKTSVG